MNSYNLSRDFVDFSFENPSKIKPNHYALFFFAIEHCNRLGWKKEFGLPTTMTMEAIGIRSYNTYSKTFNDLCEFGFFDVIERSKNQYSANVIALSNFNKALDKALDKAFIKHRTKQRESTEQSNCSIDKPINNKQINKKQETIEGVFNFRKSLLELGAKEDLVLDWLKVRKNKKATNTKTAFNTFKNQVEKSNYDVDYILTQCISNDWKGFNNDWLKPKVKNNNSTNGIIF